MKEYYWDHQYDPNKKASMTGVTVPHRTCYSCGKSKVTVGSSQRGGKFICKECKDANKPR